MSSRTTSGHDRDLERLLAEAKAGKPRPAYLIVGEGADTRAAAQRLIDELVPAARRAFNLETYDGRTTSIAAVLDSLRTPGFFAGTKLVWVREPTLFLSGEKRGDLVEALFQDWEGGREAQAAEKLLSLVALAGWTQEQLEEATFGSLPETRIREVFGEVLDAERRAAADGIRGAALARELRVAEYRDESAVLLSFLEADPLPNAVLLFTAATVDGRKKLVKRIQESGGLLSIAVERERSGALSRQAIDDIVRETAARHGKRLEAAAMEQVARRAGHDQAMLASEIEKLCLYVGERDIAREDDVRAVVIDMAASWIFDFTSALAARRPAAALQMLVSLLDQGEPPLRLLAMIARELRLLLVARESLERDLRAYWRRDLNYNAFQSRVLPHVDDATRRAFGNAHPFVLFRRYQDAGAVSSSTLREAIVRLSDLDLRLKSSAGDPPLLLQAFVLDWCRGFRAFQPAR